MRIVYIHQYYCNTGMTGGIRSYEQARRLVARGHTVDRLDPRFPGTGHASMIERRGAVLAGAAEPRTGGAAVGL